VLPSERRVKRGEDFARTIRAGRRVGRAHLVVHLLVNESKPDMGQTARTGESRAGFVVSKAVGPAVIRNRVKRRLRHLVGARLDGLPAGATLVVRALPRAAQARSAVLGRDLDSALAQLTAAAQRANGSS